MNNTLATLLFFLVCLSTLSVVTCQTVCFGKDSSSATVCSGRGSCVSNNTCVCQTNYVGVECQFTTCSGVNSSSTAVCSGNGQCTAFDTCTCSNPFSGPTCATPGCFGLPANSASVCSGRGTCTGANTCSCQDGYTGSQCEQVTCSARNNCNNRGTCVGPNICKCNAGFYGWSCESTVVCAPSNIILALPFDRPTNQTLLNLDLAPESISNNAAMLSNTTYVTESCTTALSFADKPNAEAVYQFHFDASVRFQMEFRFRLPKTLVGEQVLVWMSQNNPSLVVRSTDAALVVDLVMSANVTTSATFASNYRDDMWHHFTIQRDGSFLRFLVDGNTTTAKNFVENTFTGAFVSTGGASLIFGRTPSFTKLFKGYLDEFKIYRGCFDAVNSFLPLLTECKSCNCTNTPCLAGSVCRGYTCGSVAATSSSVCNSVGSCVAQDTCICSTTSFVGPTCSTPVCDGKNANDATVCSGHGTCASPNNCVCNRAYVGYTCQDFTCSNKNRTDTTVCSSKGTCTAPDTCSCAAKVSGANCQFFECFGTAGDSVNVCSGHGACTAVDTCTCNAGYSGSQCETLSSTVVTCFGRAQTDPLVCGGTTRGFCASKDNCQCNVGYNGTTCQLNICSGKNSNDPSVCSGSGTCTAPNTCTCNANYNGNDCQFTSCFGISSGSASACNGKPCVGPNTCKCDDGYVGDCSIPVCFGRNSTNPLVCNGRGTCTAPNVCNCIAPTSGTQCEINSCFGKTSLDASVCSGHGTCTGTDTCSCATNYFGNNCQDTICNGVFTNSTSVCSGHGTCSSPNTCTCFASDAQGYYTGANCATCRPDYTGADCKTAFCDATTTCNGRGTCAGNTCTCTGNFAGTFCTNCVAGFVGANCDIGCNPDTTCSGHGTCKQAGGCDCSQSLATGFWTGVACNTCSTGYYGGNCRYGVGTLTFANTGDRLIGFYVNPVATNPVDCAAIVHQGDLNSLGSRPFCYWNSATEFVIVLGSAPTIVPGGSVRLHADGSLFVPAPVVAPLSPIAPVASLIAPSTVGQCDGILLDASFSNNTDRRALTYTWSVADGFRTTDIAVFLALPNQNAPTIIVPASIVTAGNTFTFSLVVRNFLGASSAPVSVTVTKSSAALPLARILGTPNQRTTVSRFFRIEGVAVTTSCFTDTTGITYSWRQVSGARVSPIAEGRFLTFAPRTFSVYGDYVFELRVAPVTSSSVFSSATVTISVVPVDLVAVIAAGDRTVSSSFNLDGTASFDPDRIAGVISRYNWRCIDMRTGDTCSHASLVNIPSTGVVSFTGVPAGVYSFTLTYLKGARFATTSARIVVSAVEVPVCQVLVRNRKANRNEPLALEASVSFSRNTPLAFSWSIIQSNGAVVNLTSANTYTATTTGRSLTLREDSLELGQSYTVRFQAAVVGESTVGFSQNDIQVNMPPLPGTFTVSQTTGTALSTIFTLTCAGWADDDLPLTYSFGYRDAAGAIVPLVDRSTSNSLSTILPAGIASNGNRRTLVATIFDSLGASVQRELVVTVDQFSATTVSDITRVTDNLIANATGDSEAAARVASVAADLLASVGTSAAGQVATQFLNLMSSALNSATSKPITSAFVDSQVRAVARLISNRNAQPDVGVAMSIVTALVNGFVSSSSATRDVQQSTTSTAIRVPATTAVSVCEALGNLMAYINPSTASSYYQNILSTSKSFVGSMANGMAPGEAAVVASCAGLKLYGQTDYVSNLSNKTVAFSNTAAQVTLPSSVVSFLTTGNPSLDATSIRGIVFDTNIYAYHSSSNTTTGSTVVSFSLFDRISNELPIMDLRSPITITIPGSFDMSKYVLDSGLSGLKPVCKYWTAAGWVADAGCTVISITGSNAIIQTNHLTDFVIASENVVLDDKYIPPASVKTALWNYNPTTTVFAGVSVLGYVAMMIIMYIVDQTRGARLTLAQEKEKELLKIGYVRTIVENFKKYHVWLSVIARPLTEQEHFTRPQRITVIFTILFTLMAVNAMLVGTYPLEKAGRISGFFVAAAFISNLVAIPIVGLVTYLFRKLKVRKEQPLQPVPNITFENKSFEMEELSALPVPVALPLPAQQQEQPKPAQSNRTEEKINATNPNNKIAEDSDDEDLPATKPSTTTTNKAAKLASKSTNNKVDATFANDFEDEELRDAPVTAAVANKPEDNEPAPAPALVDDDDDDVADDDVLPRPAVPLGKTVTDPDVPKKSAGTNDKVAATFANDFENEELGVGVAVDDKAEDAPVPALDDDDDDDDVDDADVLPPPPVPLGQTVQDKPSEGTVEKALDEVKTARKDYRKSIRADVKQVQAAMGQKAPSTLVIADKVGSILDKGDDTLDALRSVQKITTPFSIANAVLFTVLYWVFHVAFVILLHLSCYYFWRPWFTTLYLMIMLLVYVGMFEIVYFQTKYKKWRLEKTWTINVGEVLIPVMLGVATIVGMIITIAVGAGLQFWAAFEGIGTGHVVSVLVCLFILLLQEISFVVLTVWKPKPYSIAKSQESDNAPWIAPWMIYVIYPLTWAYYIGCFFIIVLFGYYMTGPAGGLWVAAYIISIVLDLFAFKLGHVIVMGYFMPLYYKAVDAVFFRPWFAKKEEPKSAVGVPQLGAMATTTPAVNTAAQPSLIEEHA